MICPNCGKDAPLGAVGNDMCKEIERLKNEIEKLEKVVETFKAAYPNCFAQVMAEMEVKRDPK